MKPEEAIERINEHIEIHQYNEPQAIHIAEALQMAIEALEKQIPKTLIAEGDEYVVGSMVYDSFYCPSCHHCMEEYEVGYYCPNCGQAICFEVDEPDIPMEYYESGGK